MGSSPPLELIIFSPPSNRFQLPSSIINLSMPPPKETHKIGVTVDWLAANLSKTNFIRRPSSSQTPVELLKLPTGDLFRHTLLNKEEGVA